jgi:signal transduction histidine kinase
MSSWRVRASLVAAAVLAALLAVVLRNSAPWPGTTFPGFFVMANRVVPSIALPDWPSAGASGLFQHEVTAVDDMPLASAQEVYQRVAARPPGTLFRWTLRSADGGSQVLQLRSSVFGWGDYLLLFGAYLVNGVAFLAIGLLVFALTPPTAASASLLSIGLTTGLFVVTAVDLYGPHLFFRLHVICEALLPAAFLHLSLSFPVERLRRQRRAILAGIYGSCAALAAVYEAVLYAPAAYTEVHLVATGAGVVGSSAVIVSIVSAFFANGSPLVRRRIGIVAVGAVSGFLLPGAVILASTVLGGGVPINAAAFTAFLFPASLAYAVLQRDLFEIDVVLRRAIVYALVVLVIGGLYLGTFLVGGFFLPTQHLMDSPLAVAAIQLVLLFAVVPVRITIQGAVDRVFFRMRYDAARVLSRLGEALAPLRAANDVVRVTLHALDEVFQPRSASFLPAAVGASGEFLLQLDDGSQVEIEPRAARRLAARRILGRYEWDDEAEGALPAVWVRTAADLLVPVNLYGETIAVIALGAKRSGHSYTMLDIELLRSLVNPVALSLSNADAFGRLAGLNAELERQVAERTSALGEANLELQRSLRDLQLAYERLEKSQASLLRADRLAALGRLTAGIAHEVSTPLAAVANTLKVLDDLGREYRDSIGDPTVGTDDHREIADEILAAAGKANEWARKAAAFVNRVKLHGRELTPGMSRRFTVASVVADIESLLSHRFRTCVCRLEYRENPSGIELVGDSARLGQVLVNLVANALDAYEDARILDGAIEIVAEATVKHVTISVRDGAGGIAADVLPRVFDELFTTKEPGRGTGLGLWIARNLVEESFSGALACSSTPGVGSCFTATLAREPEQGDTSPAPLETPHPQ